MLPCFKKNMKEKKKLSSHESPVIYFFQSSSGNRKLHLHCWTLEMTIQITCLQFNKKCVLLKLSPLPFPNFYKFFVK